ncbi:hypothetical protein F4775DRAFT_539012 [Biscogniauxia sp. FL1348]|nr:hypothetical protein F4775DRAFT_539012 [Biscogniauxia sp. FL1348]
MLETDVASHVAFANHSQTPSSGYPPGVPLLSPSPFSHIDASSKSPISSNFKAEPLGHITSESPSSYPSGPVSLVASQHRQALAPNPDPSVSYICDFCQHPFGTPDDLCQHLRDRHENKHPKGRYICGRKGCKSIKRPRDLTRHLKSLHRPLSAGTFSCRCGWNHPRKDKYTTHFQSSTCSGQLPYVCRCGHMTSSQTPEGHEEHWKHFHPCGNRPAGRPPKKK